MKVGTLKDIAFLSDKEFEAFMEHLPAIREQLREVCEIANELCSIDSYQFDDVELNIPCNEKTIRKQLMKAFKEYNMKNNYKRLVEESPTNWPSFPSKSDWRFNDPYYKLSPYAALPNIV